MKKLHFRIFLFLAACMAVITPVAHAQIYLYVDVSPLPSGSSGLITGTCEADMDSAADLFPGVFDTGEYFYQGVWVNSCVLYTPDNGSVQCPSSGEGGGYISSSCTNSVDSSSTSGDYQLNAEGTLYNWYDDAGIDGDSSEPGWGTCTDSDYPFDDPLGYAYVGTISCTNVTDEEHCVNDGTGSVIWACVDESPFSDIIEADSVAYSWTPPVTISLDLDPQTINLGQKSTITANVTGADNATLQWTVIGAGTVSPMSGTISNGTITTSYAPQGPVTGEVNEVVKATVAGKSATIDVLVEPVTMSVSATPSILVATAGATSILNANLEGTVGAPSTVNWTVSSGQLPSPATGTSITYTVPTTAITAQQTVTVTAADPDTNPTTATATITLVPPVIVTSVTSPLFAGQTTSFTINGSGFGASPTLAFSPNVGTPSFSVNPAGTQIIGTISISANVPSTPVTVTVSAPNTPAGTLSATGQAAVTGATFTMAVTPSGVQLDETQSEQFASTLTCKTGQAQVCNAGSPAIKWSISPGWGSINSAGEYFANVTGISQNTPVVVTACASPIAGVAATCNTPGDQLTILPITVGNVSTPSSAVYAGKTTQFNPPAIMNAPNNLQTVNWYVNNTVGGNTTYGTISTGGLYTAPSQVSPSLTSVIVIACSTVDSSRCSPTGATVQLADFTVAVIPPLSQEVAPGKSVTYPVTVATIGSFTGSVALTQSGCPPSPATCTFSPATVTTFPGTSTLTVSTGTATPVGVDTITVIGTATGSGGTLSRTATASVSVGSPSFSVNVTPATQTVNVGSSTTYTVAVAPIDGFSGTVTLTDAGCTTGSITCTFSSTSITGGTGSSTLTVALSSSLASGTYPLTITATSGSLPPVSQIVELVVPQPGFSFAVSSTSLTLGPGTSGSATVTITPSNGFTGTVALTGGSGLPNNTAVIFSPTSIAVGSGTAAMTVAVSSAAPTGSYGFQITATSGSLVQTISMTLVVAVEPTAAPVIKMSCGVQAEVATTAAVSTIGAGITTKPTVTMTDVTPGAVIYYTDSKMATYSTTPPSTSSTEYTGPLGFPEVASTGSPLSTLDSESFSAIAVAPGYTTSAVTSAKFAYCVQGPPVATSLE